MSEGRVRIPKDKVELIKKLADGDSEMRIFNTMADCMTFAAAYGYSKGKRVPFTESAGDPIRYRIFETGNYDAFFHLLAMEAENDAHVLGNSEEMMNKRTQIFEEYANGGLELLQIEMHSSSDALEFILPIINTQIRRNNKQMPQADEKLGFDVSDLEI